MAVELFHVYGDALAVVLLAGQLRMLPAAQSHAQQSDESRGYQGHGKYFEQLLHSVTF